VDQAEAERALRVSNNNPEAALAYLLEPSTLPTEDSAENISIFPSGELEISPRTGLPKEEDRPIRVTSDKRADYKRGGKSIFGKLTKFGPSDGKRNSQDNLPSQKKPLTSSEPVLITPTSSSTHSPSQSSPELPMLASTRSPNPRSETLAKKADMMKRMTDTGIEPSVAEKAVEKHENDFDEALLEAMIAEIAPQ
jgi:hypothetical protein